MCSLVQNSRKKFVEKHECDMVMQYMLARREFKCKSLPCHGTIKANGELKKNEVVGEALRRCLLDENNRNGMLQTCGVP